MDTFEIVFHTDDLIFVVLSHMTSYHRTQLALINKQWLKIADNISHYHEPASPKDRIRQGSYYSYVKAKQYPEDIITVRDLNKQGKMRFNMDDPLPPRFTERDNLIIYEAIGQPIRLGNNERALLSSCELTTKDSSFVIQERIMSNTTLPSLDDAILSDDPRMIDLVFKQAGRSMGYALVRACNGTASIETVRYLASKRDLNPIYLSESINEIRWKKDKLLSLLASGQVSNPDIDNNIEGLLSIDLPTIENILTILGIIAGICPLDMDEIMLSYIKEDLVLGSIKECDIEAAIQARVRLMRQTTMLANIDPTCDSNLFG